MFRPFIFQHFAAVIVIMVIIWLFINGYIFIRSLNYVKRIYTDGIVRFSNDAFPPDYHTPLDHAIHITVILGRLAGAIELLIFILLLIL